MLAKVKTDGNIGSVNCENNGEVGIVVDRFECRTGKCGFLEIFLCGKLFWTKFKWNILALEFVKVVYVREVLDEHAK